jgi:hypothetical protein
MWHDAPRRLNSNAARISVAEVAKTFGVEGFHGKTEILGEFRYQQILIQAMFVLSDGGFERDCEHRFTEHKDCFAGSRLRKTITLRW